MKQTRTNQPPMVSDDEWANWLLNPTTKAMFRYIHAKIEDLRDKWESGVLAHSSLDGTLQMNTAAVGKCQAYRDLLDLDPEKIEAGLGDDE